MYEHQFTTQDRIYALQRMLEKHYTFHEVRVMLEKLINEIKDSKVGIVDITQKNTNEGSYITYILSNGTQQTIFVKNGKDGNDGNINFDDITQDQLNSLTQPAIDLVNQWKEQGLLKGDPGTPGINGVDGTPGEKGERGEKGDQGEPFRYSDFTQEQLDLLKGPKGDIGPEGPVGPQGIQGPKGEQGEPGSVNFNDLTADQITMLQQPATTAANTLLQRANNGEFNGPKGDKGDQGIQGIQGERGPKGDIGPQGPQGEKGDSGELSAEDREKLDTLSWNIGDLSKLDNSVTADNLVDAINNAAQQGDSSVPLSVVDGALCVTFNE